MHLIIDCTTTQNQLKHHGIGQYTKHVVRRIAVDEKIDITLLLYNAPSTLDSYIKGQNIQIHRLGKLRVSNYMNIFTYFTKVLPAIRQVRKENSIYFCPYFWIGIPSRYIPTVLMIHDMILPIFNTYSEQGVIQNLVKRVLYWLELRKAKYCKAILTNSKHTTKDFVKYFPKYPKRNIYTIYLDGELEESKDIKGWDSSLPKEYKEKGYFIYMGGTLAKSKNSDGIVKGYREFLVKLNFDRNAPYLVIAGKNFSKEADPSVERFRSRIECLGLKRRVIFTGYYENIHSKPLLKNSLSFIHLSLYEGFGISLVEAMKAEAPIIAHKGSCYPEILGDAGILVDGLNPKEVGNALYTVYKDERLRRELIKKGKERAKIYSWDSTVQDTLKVFKRVSSF